MMRTSLVKPVTREGEMKGGVVLFRGSGKAARRYVEADHTRADDYYLGSDDAVAEWVELGADGEAVSGRSLSADEYEAWVNWADPASGEKMGRPRLPGEGRRGSPMFAEMVVNAPKSLSVAAALHPEVSAALDSAQRDAAAEIRRWLASHSVTRVGPRGAQEVVPVERLQTVAITHRTSRAGDPHRHIHLQIGTRVWAAGAWRALDTAALFKQQGAIRALGAAVIAAHPGLAAALDRCGLTLDHTTGDVAELQRFNGVMSKRSAQIQRNLAQMRAEWETAHPGQTPGPALTARMQAAAWARGRPGKRPGLLRGEEWWRAELRDAGYDAAAPRRAARRPPVALADLPVQQVASRALDRCAAAASTWTAHTVQEHATRITTEAGVQAAPAELREFTAIATRLALEDCFSVLPLGAPAPEHVAHWTSLRVMEADMALRDLLQTSVPDQEPTRREVADLAEARGLDADQAAAAAAIASTDPLVIVEGAAGAGKTTMLGAAIGAAARQGRPARIVAPTLRAAQAAEQELAVPADSVAALVYAHGWRWNRDGVWTRLNVGELDPATGTAHTGPAPAARLARGERIVVDEAGMLDQDTAIALLTVTAEAGATVALVGDRAQLPAVGRGGVLDIAAQIRGRVFDMTGVHRFNDPAYAALTLQMRQGSDPAGVFA
ncbi:MAG: relaxase domain-containing protein, partial [Bifidobacteriaceae bacterium]|nr:relaxase domain-containing protein [Bifidobacteriaceae bacterium]